MTEVAFVPGSWRVAPGLDCSPAPPCGIMTPHHATPTAAPYMAPSTPSLIGRYRVIRALGEGGMGCVYLARDPEIDRLVAIKVMRGGSDDDLLRERFKREARAVGRLHHPNVVTIFDVGQQGNEPFIAMEYVEGATLASLIRNGEPVGLLRRLAIMDGLCAGLHYAHRAGIIHRDIKPANVMITGEGGVKIVDFGIARGDSSGITQSGAAIGTVNYMSPEQLTGQPIDQRSDIFAVGAVFYELLSGQRAFPGDLQSGVLHRIISGAPEPLDRLCPGLSTQVIAIVDRCLEKDPQRRYPDLDAMRKALAAVNRAGSNDTTVPLRPRAPDDPPRLRTPRPPSDGMRTELLRQRQERIDGHLEQARAALAASDFPAALAACHQALILDPEHSESVDLQDLIERTRQAHDWLKDARSELDRGALTAASDLVNRVLAIFPAMPEALEARHAIVEARRDLEERRARARALDDAMSRAERHLDADELALAAAALDAALILETDHPQALALKTAIAQRVESRKRVERHALAQNAIADARRLFAAGSYQAAVERLVAFRPAHADVDEVRLALEFEWGEIRRREEEQRRLETLKQQEATTERLTGTPAVRDATDSDSALVDDAQPASRSHRAKLIAGVAAALLLVAVLWAVFRPEPVTPITATVLFDFRPWAQIEAIVLKSGGQNIEPSCAATPCLMSLDPGDYFVRARSPYLAAALEFDLTVVAGEHQDVRRTFPDFKAADEARRILEGR